MDLDEILKLSYDEFVESLLKKYGSVQNDYYRNEVCLTRSGNSRSREGLVIHHIDEDKVLTALERIVEKDGKFNGETIYQHYVDPETELMHREWRPNAFLTLELCSSLSPKDGNATEWKKDKSALLFTDKTQLKELNGFRIREQYGDYLVLEHTLTDIK